MALEFITGRPGAGKSYTAYSEMITDSLLHPEKQYLVIVPEQFTMQTQREIAEMHPAKALLNIDVLSFNRLAYRVFGEVGGNTLPVLEDTGKSLVIQKVTEDCRPSLKVMGHTLSRQGAVSEMKSLVSELLQYRVSEDVLEEWIGEQNHNPRLAGKLEDVRTIYRAFNQYLEDHYLTTEEVPGELCRVISDSELVKGSVILLDGFTGFTPAQEQVVQKLLMLAEKVTVILTADSPEDLKAASDPGNLFHMSYQMYDRTFRLAEEASVPVTGVRCVDCGEAGRFSADSPLGHLERNIFRYGKKEKYTGPQNAIHITEAADPEHEIMAAAGVISRMVRNGNGRYHYRDFAVVTGDPEAYGRAAERIFGSAGIPYFIDRKKSVMTNPAVEFVRAALDMVVQQYSYDSVFRFLRTGMADFTDEEIDDLDNYCLALGIHGRGQYEEPWRRTTAKRKNGIRKAVDPEKLLYYNGLRERFTELTADFDKGLHERMGTALRKTEVLYDFICRCHIQEKTERYAGIFEQQGDRARALEYSQIYPAVIDLLDKIADVLGDEKLRMKEYQEIVDAGLAEVTIGIIPPGEDQVMVGDIERTRLKNIRVLFMTGVNDGIVPKTLPANGILSEPDRENLERSGARLSPTSRERMYQQRFYLYLSLTKPSDRLYISYCRTGSDGTSLRPSFLIGMIGSLYENMSVRNISSSGSMDVTERIETLAGETEYLLEELQNLPEKGISAEGRALIWKTGNGSGEDRRQNTDALIRAVTSEKPDDSIPAELAEKLYGTNIGMSVTRLENFNACAFRHFLDYGLELQEREEYEFTPADFGSIMHEALERFSKELKKSGYSWRDLDDKSRDALADRAVAEVTGDYGNTILQSSKRNEHMIFRLKEMMRKTVWALQEQVRRGSFTPTDFEFQFDERESLSSLHFRIGHHARMGLIGRVDRLDECVFDGTRYLKIIDYKTGNTDMDLNQMYAGLQLQLSVYMNAAVERENLQHPGERTEPAGIFYYHIKDPVITLTSGEEADREKLKDKVLSELRPAGMVRSEERILRLFDHETESGVSNVLPSGVRISGNNPGKKTGEDGKRNENSRARNEEEFHVISRFTDSKVAETGSRMIEGEVSVNPCVQYRSGAEYTACTYCPYRAVCEFDERIPGFAYRKIGTKGTDDVLNDMRRDLGHRK